MKISDVKQLLSEYKTDIVEGICGGCGDFSHDHPCPESCEYMRKINAVEKAGKLLDAVESLQTSAKESTDE